MMTVHVALNDDGTVEVLARHRQQEFRLRLPTSDANIERACKAAEALLVARKFEEQVHDAFDGTET